MFVNSYIDQNLYNLYILIDVAKGTALISLTSLPCHFISSNQVIFYNVGDFEVKSNTGFVKNKFITFPFYGIPIEPYFYELGKQKKKIKYSFPEFNTFLLSTLFRMRFHDFQYLNNSDFFYGNFQWIDILNKKMNNEDKFIPKLADLLKEYPGFVYLGKQNYIKEYSDFDFLISTIKNDSLSLTVKNTSFAYFNYIVPESIDIIERAIKIKNLLKHQFVHIQIDCSFKCTRPYVFAVPHVEIGHASIPLGLIITPTKKG